MVDIFPPRGMPGAVAENWARASESRTIALENGLKALEQASAGDNRSLASQIAQLTNIINSMPLPGVAGTRATGFGITGSYATYATVTLPVPNGKTTMNAMCIGSGAVLDATTGGLTTAYGRCIIGASTGGEFPAAKDAGVSQVNNIITASHTGSFAVTPGSLITVSFQMYGLSPTAFPARPSNFAQIAVQAVFS